MRNICNSKKINSIAQNCINLSWKERTEVAWLKEKYSDFCFRNGLKKKAEADLYLYKKMYSKAPENLSALSKIRFWRTGKHIPINRSEVKALGEALELSKEDMKYLFQNYWNHSDIAFDENDHSDEEYKRRAALIQEYIHEYLLKVHPSRRLEININGNDLSKNLRHLYFTDAYKYVYPRQIDKSQVVSHITSVNYGSELIKNINLYGEIPRKTMIRHLIIWGMPYINLDILNERLTALGYAPLAENHTLSTGEYLDRLIIELLNLYDKECSGKDFNECMDWFQKACQILDSYFVKNKQDNLRFMHFKALDL